MLYLEDWPAELGVVRPIDDFLLFNNVVTWVRRAALRLLQDTKVVLLTSIPVKCMLCVAFFLANSLLTMKCM